MSSLGAEKENEQLHTHIPLVIADMSQHTLLYFDESDIFPYQPIAPIWIVIYALPSFLFFVAFSRTVETSPNGDKNIKSNWLRHNTLLSFVHASICSILILIALVRAPEMLNDPLSHANHFNYALIAFTIGYFLYDFMDCIQNSTSSTLAILLHHIVVVSFLTHTLFHTRNIGYAIHALSLEVNSIFLHARRLLRWYSPISSSIYFKQILRIVVNFGNYLTFIIFRFGIVAIGLRALYIQKYRLDPIIHIFTVIVVLSIGFLNVILFYRLAKNDFFGNLKSKQKKQKEDNMMMTNEHILLPS